MKTNTVLVLLSLSILTACNWKWSTRVTLDLRNVPLQTVLDSISAQANIHFEITDGSDETLTRRITIKVVNEEPGKVIEEIRKKEKDLDFYPFAGDIFVISTRPRRVF